MWIGRYCTVRRSEIVVNLTFDRDLVLSWLALTRNGKAFQVVGNDHELFARIRDNESSKRPVLRSTGLLHSYTIARGLRRSCGRAWMHLSLGTPFDLLIPSNET